MNTNIQAQKNATVTVAKKIFLSLAFLIFMQYSFAQLVPSRREDSTKTNQLSTLLNAYYSVKNALIGSDATAAAAKAGELISAIGGIDMKALSAADHTAFMGTLDKLKKDAETIATSGKIETQRTAFSSLSNTIFTLAKTARLSAEPVYQQYCPMKKMYWLSNETAIKNPYYGKMMLTCGKVTETL
jgi:hypothetical protein